MHSMYNRYTFPYKNGSEFRFMRKLCTTWVNVSGEVVTSFLRNCPLLEHLSVTQSLDLSSLEVINTFPSFKRLEIYMCFNLESVVIRDSNLVVLKILLKMYVHGAGWPKLHQFDVRNVPLLTEIWTADESLELFSTVLPQIEMLKLYTTGQFEDIDEEAFPSLSVEMSNLKQFVVEDTGKHNKYSILLVINLIKASHGLQRFVLEAPENYGSSASNIPITLPIPRKGIRQHYPCLKEVQFAVNGCASRQLELVMHFVETGVALQNIVVDPYVHIRHPLCFRCGWDALRLTETNTKTLEMASVLQSILPSTINLTIL